jgi:hypothetical protein
VKVSDGGSHYVTTKQGVTYRPDGQVAGAKSIGLPVGGYHFAKLAPSPEAQADVLTTEVHRLGALGLPPALDVEKPFVPGKATRDFAIRFLRRLKENGFGRVAVYGNASMMTAIRPDQWDIDGLVIWVARYGPNDGTYHPGLGTYPGRADVHQYTDKATVSGIGPATVDLNESLTDITEEDMSWNEQLTFTAPGGKINTYEAQSWLMWTNYYANMIPGIATTVATQGGQIASLVELVKQLAADENLDLEAIKRAAEEGTRKALDETKLAAGPAPVNG